MKYSRVSFEKDGGNLHGKLGVSALGNESWRMSGGGKRTDNSLWLSLSVIEKCEIGGDSEWLGRPGGPKRWEKGSEDRCGGIGYLTM